VVAEYAFAMALRDKTRVIYTSPLKALSNQKYRELYEEFQDVGLMTGDVTINPEASCLVMTTEILRSMLYRGSEVVREVQLLVYDEIHYLRDKERGVVWEESIILAPKSCRFAFLSATIPNALEFASWVAKTHNSPCHVVYTDYRPTPLQHFIFPASSDSLFMVVDERGVFREDNFQKAVAVVHDAGADGGKKKQDKTANKSEGNKTDIFRIVKMIIERNFDPVIVFAFSKKECERLVLSMSALDLTDDTEKKLVSSIFKSAVECLSQDDQRLPQVNNILPMLKRGIGLHHSGLLPIIKEVIEILFSEGLLKVLFATETFSTGLNMPAKTVVFTNARKFDGGSFRWVTSGEYIQMSGRAGRRGLDDKGVVILMLDAKMESSIAKEMIKGAPDHMHSEFHLGYNMLLNLATQEDRDAEQLMASSFRQFQVERSLPRLEAQLGLLRGQHNSLLVPNEASAAAFMSLLERHFEISLELRPTLSAPQYSLPFLQPGRLIRVLTEPLHPGHPLPSFDLFSDSEIEAAGAAFGDKNVG
jgi:ATP-dependent RNA helicase DOB1